MSQQPDKETSYNTAGNAASKQPAEQSNANAGQQGGAQVEHRKPSQQTSQDDATPQSSARGIRGAGPGENPANVSAADKGESHVDDADEQISAPGEGKVASAVKNNSSGGGRAGRQDGTESELDRKKAEQAPARAAMKQEGKKEVDVGGVLGQRAAPADPSDS